MSRVLPYREIGAELEDRRSFIGNSMSGYRREDGGYYVYSYSTLIATYDPDTGRSWVSENHWGQTSGRHIGMCQRHLPAIVSNAEEAIDGIGPGAKVAFQLRANGEVGEGWVREVYPLSGKAVVRPCLSYDALRANGFRNPDPVIIPVTELELI